MAPRWPAEYTPMVNFSPFQAGSGLPLSALSQAAWARSASCWVGRGNAVDHLGPPRACRSQTEDGDDTCEYHEPSHPAASCLNGMTFWKQRASSGTHEPRSRPSFRWPASPPFHHRAPGGHAEAYPYRRPCPDEVMSIPMMTRGSEAWQLGRGRRFQEARDTHLSSHFLINSTASKPLYHQVARSQLAGLSTSGRTRRAAVPPSPGHSRRWGRGQRWVFPRGERPMTERRRPATRGSAQCPRGEASDPRTAWSRPKQGGREGTHRGSARRSWPAERCPCTTKPRSDTQYSSGGKWRRW